MDQPPEIPSFLKRTPGDVKVARSPLSEERWKTTPAMEVAKQRANKKQAKEDSKFVVADAIIEGADTFGKIKKAVGLEDKIIRIGLKAAIKGRKVFKQGRRYYPV